MIAEGLLWYDDSPTRSTEDKIGNAVARYKQKYGHAPDMCYVHPASLAGLDPSSLVIPSGQPGKLVQITSLRSVLPNHFWLGVNATVETSKRRAPQAIHALQGDGA